MGRIFTIIGKSATGKDHIYKALLQDEALRLFPLVPYTTRPMRSGEKNGREYVFVEKADLERLRGEGRIIEERVYETVHGPWHYFTADEGQIDLDRGNYLAIGTLESYLLTSAYFGEGKVVPIYIETDDATRLRRSVQREEKQTEPKYAEVCRRFLADEADFSEDKLREAGIERRFSNNADIADCIQEIRGYIKGKEE